MENHISISGSKNGAGVYLQPSKVGYIVELVRSDSKESIMISINESDNVSEECIFEITIDINSKQVQIIQK